MPQTIDARLMDFATRRRREREARIEQALALAESGVDPVRPAAPDVDDVDFVVADEDGHGVVEPYAVARVLELRGLAAAAAPIDGPDVIEHSAADAHRINLDALDESRSKSRARPAAASRNARGKDASK